MKITKQTFNNRKQLEKLITIANDLETLFHKDIEMIDPFGMKYLNDMTKEAIRIMKNADRLAEIEISTWNSISRNLMED